MAKIIAISGSLREKSFNTMLLKIGVSHLEAQGATVTVVDLGELDLPFLNEDLESKDENGKIVFPEKVENFRKLVTEHDGLFLATPEYNFSISAVLKNAIDWLSRPGNVLKDKTVGMVGASAGPYGTALAQEHLRTILSILAVRIVNRSARVPSAYQNFDFATGQLKDDLHKNRVHGVADGLIEEINRAKSNNIN
eukprot:TRINITY_DN1921_c0_g1_i1.p1 TRINITY_DN1921_c0_g1~~TRINITY_DN1921_c0_g1_i1.p1  ORF type:complete len:195 (-),score=89.17 TRINITY_DN1921_c0_g1_i1:226-810(-)